jgi:hypothetical protein
VAAHVLSDRRLGDLEAGLEQLTMNTRRAPKCVGTAAGNAGLLVRIRLLNPTGWVASDVSAAGLSANRTFCWIRKSQKGQKRRTARRFSTRTLDHLVRMRQPG